MITLAKIENAQYKANLDVTEIKITTEGDLTPEMLLKDAKNLEVRIRDSRRISSEQRKKAYATLNDLCDFTGDVVEYLKEYFKYVVMCKIDVDYFSLSDCSVTVAKEYISEILDKAIELGAPLHDLGANIAEDIDRYLYMCLKTRTCAITGKKGAEIHHVTGSRVGMGRNRVKINHGDLKVVALSREWHNKVHAEGELKIFEDHKIYGIKLDDRTLRDLGLRAEEIG